MKNVSVYYDSDTKVATSGSTCTFFRINIKLEPKGKNALMLMRNGKEPLKEALERLIEEGIERIMGEEE